MHETEAGATRAQAGVARATDGARLHYEVTGEGPWVVLNNGLANDAYQWSALRRALAGRARVLTWDYRGHGRSEPARDLGTLAVPDLVADLRAVLDAAGVGRATLLGYSLGAQVSFEAWRHSADRIAGLVSVLGVAGRTFDNAAGPLVGRLAHAALRHVPDTLLAGNLRIGAALPRLTHASGRLVRMFEPDLSYADFAPWYSHLGALHAPTLRAMVLALRAHDAEDLLPTLTVPALVVSGGRDAFVRRAVSRRIAAAIPGSRHIDLPRATHAGLVGHADALVAAVVAFLDGHALIAPRSLHGGREAG
jgi:pimeloyl-ACP methyl ester carboxylesterase